MSDIEKQYSEAVLEYRKELVTLLHKSQDIFEKQLSYISAGALALSIGFMREFVKDISNRYSLYFLFAGWISLAVTLLLNLISHNTAAKVYWTIIKKIDENTYSAEHVTQKTKKITVMNNWCIFLLFLGFVLIITFVGLNFYDMNDNKKLDNDPKITTTHIPKDKVLTEKLGYLPSPPPSRPTSPDPNSKPEKK